MTASPTIVSSPGKVLIAGGYLVLDPAHRGLVISTSSRFYTVISTPSTASPTITVRSPQFCEAEWVYSVDSNTGSVKEEESQGGKNKFVRIAVEKSLKVAEERVGRDKIAGVIAQGMEIVILGDNDFYSQRKQLESLSLPLSIASLSHLPPFSPTNNTLASVHKTGLGSSAALITSLCAALLLHLGAVPASAFSSGANEDMQLLHNVAQYCHCYAQGKVGSGFDVSSAVWGSQLYRKFGKEALEDLMSDEGAKGELLPSLLASNPRWTNEVKQFSLPPGTRLMLADVDAGSDTPSLVGKVLGWKSAEKETADLLWRTISNANEALAVMVDTLSTMAEMSRPLYDEALRIASDNYAQDWFNGATGDLLSALEVLGTTRSQTQTIRSLMKKMGELSGVPIEPDSQTKLLDACLECTGVLGCGVPGAGGFDAVWVLVVDAPASAKSPTPAEQVEKVWTSWTEMSVCPLSARAEPSGGLKIEKIEDVKGLEEVLARE